MDLELDGISHADYPVATTDIVSPGEGIIGNGFLDGFIVTIDGPAGKVYLDPVSSDDGIPMPPDPLGANLSWDGESPIIGSIVPGSTPTDVGLELGEVVWGINTEDHSTMALSEVLRPAGRWNAWGRQRDHGARSHVHVRAGRRLLRSARRLDLLTMAVDTGHDGAKLQED